MDKEAFDLVKQAKLKAKIFKYNLSYLRNEQNIP